MSTITRQDPKLKVVVHHNVDAAMGDHGVEYLACRRCQTELEHLRNVSPKEYARQQVSQTYDGIQVWCTRHNCNIDLMTFRAERKR